MPFLDPNSIRFDSPPNYANPEANNAIIAELYNAQPEQTGGTFLDPSKVQLDQPQPTSTTRDSLQSAFEAKKGAANGEITSFTQGFNSMVPFGNRITAGMAALANKPFTDLSLGELYDTARENQQATSEASPNADMAGSIMGGLASLPIGFSKAVSAAPLIGTAANALQKTAQATGNFVRGGEVAANAGILTKAANLAGQSMRGAIVAAPTAGLYGYGNSQNDLDSSQAVEDGLAGAGMGAAFGGAAPVAGAALGAGVGYAADKVATLIGKSSGELTKESLSPQLQKVFNRLRTDYPDNADFTKALYSYGSTKDKALIEAGGARLDNLAKGAAVYPSGEAKAAEFFDDAVGNAPDKLKASLSKAVSPSTNYSDDVDVLLEKGRAKAAPLYKGAFSANQSVSSPLINKILLTPEGKSSLGEAVKNIQNEMALVAKPDPELTQLARELSDIGLMDAQKGGVASGLKLRALDEVKRSMDKTIQSAYRTGKSDSEIARFVSLKNALVSELDKADKSGLYANARATAGDYLSSKKAMEDGLQFLSDDVENISRRMSNMGSAQKTAYRSGIVKALRNDIDQKNDGQNVARLFKKPANRAKLETLLSPQEYFKLRNDAMATDRIFDLRNDILRGSQTASRQMAAKEFDQEGGQVIMEIATRGFIRTTVDRAAKVIYKTFDGLSDKSAKEVANILFETDPKEKYKIVQALVNEANKTTGLRSTDAAKKLGAFYKFSDAVSMARSSTPLKATISPSDKGTP